MCQEPPAGSISLVKRNSSCRINCRFRAIRRENRSESPSDESKGGTVMLLTPAMAAASASLVARKMLLWGSSRVLFRLAHRA